MKKKLKPITVEIAGGFGNQLFMAAAGWAQAQRLGCGLRFDINWYHSASTHKLLITDLGFPGVFKKANVFSKFISRFGLNRNLVGATYRESSFDFDKKLFQISSGTKLIGYFQSPKYFTGIEDALFELLEFHELQDHEKKQIQIESAKPFIACHVRRGDYASNPAALKVHGLCSKEYFERAIALLRQDKPEIPVLVFTDSRQEVEKEFSVIRNVRFIDVDANLSELATIKLMSLGDSIIISNSTFSWWAAWMGSNRRPSLKVVSPVPWFANGDGAVDLIPSSWAKISAR